MFVQNHLRSVQAAEGTASATSLVLSLSEFMLHQGNVLGASLLRIQSCRKIQSPCLVGTISCWAQERWWCSFTPWYLGLHSHCTGQEWVVYLDGDFQRCFQKWLIDDDRPQSLVPSNELSEQNAICSELLISSMVHFIRDGRWPECMKCFNKYYSLYQ